MVVVGLLIQMHWCRVLVVAAAADDLTRKRSTVAVGLGKTVVELLLLLRWCLELRDCHLLCTAASQLR